jgi:hypothetical protein
MKALLIVLISLLSTAHAQKIQLPEKGAFVGAYVDAGPVSDDVRPYEVEAFEALIGKKLSWVYFSNNWENGDIIFPAENVEKLRKLGRVPYIRLMPWSEYSGTGFKDPIFTMDNFLSGQFDEQLIAWAQEALKSPGPMILEFGPEVNGNWFPWNGQWNGGGKTDGYGDPKLPDGPEKFRDTYRRVINLFRMVGLTDVTWVLHVDTARLPEVWWNKTPYYYPGDEYIDWIGLSAFGAQLPTHKWQDMMPKFKAFWPEIESIAKTKPLIISEFAVIEDKKTTGRKAQWLNRALRMVETGLYPIKGITYWNSPGWLADGSADFRITSSQSAIDAFKERINQDFWKVLNIQPSESVE